jgi:hypothetical protein
MVYTGYTGHSPPRVGLESTVREQVCLFGQKVGEILSSGCAFVHPQASVIPPRREVTNP